MGSDGESPGSEAMGSDGGESAPPAGSDGVHELVDQALGDVGLADDALLVILPDGAAQLVVVHGGAVLADAPEPGHLGRVLDFENAWGRVGRPQESRGRQTGERGRARVSLAGSPGTRGYRARQSPGHRRPHTRHNFRSQGESRRAW